MVTEIIEWRSLRPELYGFRVYVCVVNDDIGTIIARLEHGVAHHHTLAEDAL